MSPEEPTSLKTHQFRITNRDFFFLVIIILFFNELCPVFFCVNKSKQIPNLKISISHPKLKRWGTYVELCIYYTLWNIYIPYMYIFCIELSCTMKQQRFCDMSTARSTSKILCQHVTFLGNYSFQLLPLVKRMISTFSHKGSISSF